MEGKPVSGDVLGEETLEEEVLALTREFVRRFWEGDVDWCSGVIAPDFTWIGAQAEQFDMGPSVFRAVHASVAQQMPNVIIVDEEYRYLPITDTVAMVLCQYLGYTDPSSDMVMADKQRSTFIWRRGEGGMELLHQHVSNPLKPAMHGEAFPVSFAKETHRYMIARARQLDVRNTCELRDAEGSTHFMNLSDVVYLEANKQSTVVHCLDTSFRVRGGISDIAAKLDSASLGVLIRTHRSYMVNALYVERIDRDAVALTTGEKLALSSRRRAEVEEAIAAARG